VMAEINPLLSWAESQVFAGGTYVRDIATIAYCSFRDLFLSSSFRRGAMMRVLSQQIVVTGGGAFPMVTIMALLFGSAIIIQSGGDEWSVGAENLLRLMLVEVLIREFGALLIAFVVIGCFGVPICKELANLCVENQIKALRMMGIRILGFVVFPQMLVVVVAMICLIIYFYLIAMMGGIIVSTFVFGEPVSVFFYTLEQSIGLIDVLIMLTKGVIFALVVAVICCHHGLLVEHEVSGVSQATMHAVMGSVIVCVLIEVLFILLRSVFFS